MQTNRGNVGIYVVIALLLVAGGYYFMKSSSDKADFEVVTVPSKTEATNDAVATLTADASLDTGADNLDASLDSLDAELSK